MNKWTHYLTQFTRTPSKLLSDFWTLGQCAVRALPSESDLSGAAYRPCPSNCPSPAQQWEEWVNQWAPLLLQAFLAFLFQREILPVNIFMLQYKLCLYTFNSDPSSPAKNLSIVGCLEMPQPSYYYKGSDQNPEDSTAERWKKLDKQLTESSQLNELLLYPSQISLIQGEFFFFPQKRSLFLRTICFPFILSLNYIETLRCAAVI